MGGGRRWDERDGVLDSWAVTLLDSLVAAVAGVAPSHEEEEEERGWRESGEVAASCQGRKGEGE